MKSGVIKKSILSAMAVICLFMTTAVANDDELVIPSLRDTVTTDIPPAMLILEDSIQYKIDRARLGIVGGSIAATYATIYLVYLREGWWSETNSFRFEDIDNDINYASNMDKFGHFYISVLLSELFTISYDWVGMSPFASTLWAGISVSVTHVVIELKDGFSPYGFSVLDIAAGTLGAFYSMGKRFIPAMQYVDYKFAYFPHSQGYWNHKRREESDGGIGGILSGQDGVFTDDYYGGNHTHWLSFKVAKMLPPDFGEWYPEWLQFAFGWGIDDRHWEEDGWGKSRYEFYLSLDYDLETLFRPKRPWSQNVVRMLNFIKFPAPAVRFGPNARFFALHPIHFSINNIEF